ncbi:MAG: hypothetical protein ACFFFG_18470 [Candidatus Thorarchaeota archaeon]
MRRSSLIISILGLMILLPIELVDAVYSNTVYNDDSWADDHGSGTWGDENYNAATDQYELKAWNFWGLDGYAWYDWDTQKEPYGDGGLTAEEIGTATLKIKWEFDGELKTAGNGHLKFTYTMTGPGSPTLSSGGIIDYTEDQSWTDQVIYHTFTTSTLYDGATYYVQCHIYLLNDTGAASDLMSGGDGLKLIWVRLYR